MKEISVIIPFYQVGYYLRECLVSVINQSIFEKCEVVLVNDGATDVSVSIAHEFADRYENITVYDYENGGLSKARNRGIRHSHGKYLFFLDSDDLIEADYIESLYLAAEKNSADMVLAGFSEVDEDGKNKHVIRREVLENITDMCTGLQYLEKRIKYGDWYNQVWCAIYNRDFLIKNNLLYEPPVRLYEDILFSTYVLIKAEKVVTIAKYGYLYRIRSGSLIHNTFPEKDLKACINILEILLNRYEELTGKAKTLYGQIIIEHMAMTFYHIGMSEINNKNMYYRKLSYRTLLWRAKKCPVTIAEKCKYIIFVICPQLYYQALNIRKKR